MKLFLSHALPLLAILAQNVATAAITSTNIASVKRSGILLDPYSGPQTAHTGNEPFTFTELDFTKQTKQGKGGNCYNVPGCKGHAAYSPAAYSAGAVTATYAYCNDVGASLRGYMTQNNYSVAQEIIGGSSQIFAFNMTLHNIHDYLNLEVGLLSGAAGNAADACDNTDPELVTLHASNSLYTFCVSLGGFTDSTMPTRFDKAYLDNDAGKAKGKVLATKFYISNMAFNFGPECTDEGITF